MRLPPIPFNLYLLLLAAALLLTLVQVGLLSIAFDKLGLSMASAILLLMISLVGSTLNLPLFHLKTETFPEQSPLPPPLDLLWKLPRWQQEGRTIIALNVGGGLVPLLFSAYLLGYHALPLWEVAVSVAGVTAISYTFSRPMPGLGIGMPVLIAPLSAALIATVVRPDQSAPLAYICGTLGVLIGADLLRLKDIRRLGASLASIGGAGTFDGIYLTGLVAVLLA